GEARARRPGISSLRPPATTPVDNGPPNPDNTRAHERGDPRDPEDDERGLPARDPVPELGARPRGRAPKSLSRESGRLFCLSWAVRAAGRRGAGAPPAVARF